MRSERSETMSIVGLRWICRMMLVACYCDLVAVAYKTSSPAAIRFSSLSFAM
jgi:hypothetical protein